MADTCPDCGRLKAIGHLWWLNNYDTSCAAATGASDAKLNCNAVTVTNLRARIAQLEQQQAEREHLEEGAKLALDFIHDMKSNPTPTQWSWMQHEHERHRKARSGGE